VAHLEAVDENVELALVREVVEEEAAVGVERVKLGVRDVSEVGEQVGERARMLSCGDEVNVLARARDRRLPAGGVLADGETADKTDRETPLGSGIDYPSPFREDVGIGLAGHDATLAVAALASSDRPLSLV
jgi:hypothetical protein